MLIGRSSFHSFRVHFPPSTRKLSTTGLCSYPCTICISHSPSGSGISNGPGTTQYGPRSGLSMCSVYALPGP